MNNFIRDILTGFQTGIEKHNFPDTNIKWFKCCTYLLLLLKMLFIWPELSMFYRHALSVTSGSLMPHELFFLPLFKDSYHFYWLAACIVVGVSIFYRRFILLSIAVFVITMNYFLLANKAINTGDKLLNFFIFMSIFVQEGSLKNGIRKMINNAVLIVLQVHFCLLYVINAFGKIINPFWRDGSSFNSIWHLSYYANPNLIPHWLLNPKLYFITAWVVIIFELIFPVLIWFRPFKKPVLIAGILFHIGIAASLSLPDFGVTMIIGYLLFFDFKQIYTKANTQITV